MPLVPVPSDPHPSAIELEDWWFAQQPQPPGAPTVDRAPADLLEVGEHLRTCGRCAAHLTALEEERSAFLAALPPSEMLPRPRRRPPRLLTWAAVLLVGFLLGWLVTAPRTDDSPELRAKGSGPALQVSTTDGDAPSAGDTVRFSVSLPDGGYPLLVVVQEDGARSLAYPPDPSAQQPIPAGTPVLLPGGAVLDGYAGREELWMWVSPSPPDASAVRDALSGRTAPDATALLREAP